MTTPDDDAELVFVDEPVLGPSCALQPPPQAWQVLVVDDDPDVFQATRFALDGVTLFGRRLSLQHAASAAQARGLLAEGGGDIALALLDVVMETQTAGLDLVQHIRRDLGLSAMRVVLRTGQPGYAPEQETILRYDINDYRTKDELSQQRLLTSVATALRSYQQICALQAYQEGLQRVVRASAGLMAAESLAALARAGLEDMAFLLDRPAEGLALLRQSETLEVLAGAGVWAARAGLPLEGWPAAQALIRLGGQALDEQRCVAGAPGLALPVVEAADADLVLVLEGAAAIDDTHAQWLEMLRLHLQACSRNLALRQRLHRQAYLDPLLGLPNRTRFIEHIDEALRTDTGLGVLALVDIDDFAAVNDLMGHAYGDAVLAAAARRLQDHFGPAVVLARMNSNTFGLLGPALVLDPEAVRNSMREPLLVDGRPHHIRVTAGFANLAPDLQPGADWLKDVGIALKHAKTQQRGGHLAFSPGFGQASRQRAQLLAELHEAFAASRLFLVYQPQMDLASGAVLGLEALLRWRTEQGQLVPPTDFIPLAEQSGLILRLGQWVLHQACATMRELIDQGLAPLRMAVNVSVVQFRQPDFASQVLAALRAHGLPGSALELELTESVSLQGESAAQVLTGLRAHGVSVAIDDFGTGYSSLSYLGSLPVDCLKIDRAFVLQLDQPGAPRVAELVTQLGHKLQLRVLAEGIETEQARDRLVALGCLEGQGYWYARPLALPELRAWLQARS